MLHGGATAVFRVESMGEAVRLAEAVAAVPGLAGSGALLTVADTALTVRLSRDMWKLESPHVELARSVSAVARVHGAVADRAAVQEVQFAVAAKPEAIDLGFWRAVLGYVPMGDDNGVDPLGHGSTVWMQDLDEAKPLRHAMHIDVSVAREHAEARLAAALAAGGRIVVDSGAPGALDPRRSRREPRLHRRVAGRGPGPGRSGGGAVDVGLTHASQHAASAACHHHFSTEGGESPCVACSPRCSWSARGPRSSSGG